jgi:hypothetical protein
VSKLSLPLHSPSWHFAQSVLNITAFLSVMFCVQNRDVVIKNRKFAILNMMIPLALIILLFIDEVVLI